MISRTFFQCCSLWIWWLRTSAEVLCCGKMKAGHYAVLQLCTARDRCSWTVVTVLLASKPSLPPFSKGSWVSVGSGGVPALLLPCVDPLLSVCKVMPAFPSWSLPYLSKPRYKSKGLRDVGNCIRTGTWQVWGVPVLSQTRQQPCRWIDCRWMNVGIDFTGDSYCSGLLRVANHKL